MYETLFILYVGKKTDWIKWKDIFWLEVIQKTISFFIFPGMYEFLGKMWFLDEYTKAKLFQEAMLFVILFT